MLRFANALPKMRRITSNHLRHEHLDREKVLAAMTRLMNAAYFRVGDERYFGNTTDQGDNTLAGDGISYVYALDSLPEAHFIPYGTTPPPQCPGQASFPEADPGHLCVYEQDRENIADG